MTRAPSDACVMGKLGRKLAVLAFLVALPAQAEPVSETAALRWLRGEGAESCPAEADVARAIAQRWGRPALVPHEEAELVVEAKLSAVPAGGFRVDITLLRGDEVVGQRDLESDDPSCQIVAENAALVIALAIDPDGSAEPLPIDAPADPPPSPLALPLSLPVEPPHPVPAPPPVETPWQGDLELAVGVASGIVPELSPAFYLRGRALPPGLPFGIELEGAFFPSQRVEAVPGKGADFTELHVGAALCSRPPRTSQLRGSLCAGAAVGTISGQAYGFSDTPRFRELTVELAARGRLGFLVLPGLAAVVGPDFWLPLKRDHFEGETLAGTQPIFRMSAVGLGFALGMVWEL